MKGLLTNNFYAVRASAKVFSIFMLILGAFISVVISQQLLLFYMLLGIIGFSINAVASMGKDCISKWGRYKLTAPVRRAAIVKSCFITQFLWLLVGMVFSGIVMSASWLLHGCPFDRSVDALLVFSLGISISVFAGAFFFPLFYSGGEERNGAFLVISLLFAIGIAMGMITAINIVFGPNMTTWQLISAAMIMFVCSLSTSVLSYFLTVAIFKRREY